MGDENEYLKTRNTGAAFSAIGLKEAVPAAMASFAPNFREILGSEPIVYQDEGGLFLIHTYGAGAYVQVGRFGIREFPGCCGLVVFYHASVTERFQAKGLGRLFLKVREKAAVLAGYPVALATVLKANKAERSLLESEKWKEDFTFTNTRTKHEVVSFRKSLL